MLTEKVMCTIYFIGTGINNAMLLATSNILKSQNITVN